MKEFLKLLLIIIVVIILSKFVFNLISWTIGGLVVLAFVIGVLYGIVWLLGKIFR